jgi:hypothetical protein
MSDTQGYYGQIGETDANDEFNSHRFLIKQLIGQVRTGIPVKIVAVHGGGLGAAPTVDVQPQINQIDGQGNQTPHGIIYGIPVVRNQGGGNAVINDPVIGDIGHAVVSDRDISSLQANAGAQSNPGSFRRHDLADMVYHAAFLNPATPTQYVWFKPGGGVVLSDNAMNVIETFPTGPNLITVRTAEPAGPTKLIILGGDGTTGGYGFLETDSGPSINVKARIS